MNVLVANEITPSMLTHSSAPEHLIGQTEWSNVQWPLGSIVTRSATRRVYRAVYDVPAGGIAPEENIAIAQLPYWIDVGPMNQWALFDGGVGTQMKSTGDTVVTLQPGPVSEIWFGNMTLVDGVQVIVRSSPGGPVVYSKANDLYPSRVTTYWGWWFSPFSHYKDTIFEGIPSYANCEVEITFFARGEMAVGMAAIGEMEDWGCTEWGVSVDFNRYSARTLQQTWGPSQATGGEVTKDISYRVFIESEQAPRVDESTKRAMKRPAVYLPTGDQKFEGIRIFGQAMSARMGYPSPNHVPLDITIREFI